MNVDRFRWEEDDLVFRAKKYSPDQPRVPAGSPEGVGEKAPTPTGHAFPAWKSILLKWGWLGEKAYTDAGTYRSGIRAAVRGLWTGNLDWDQFFDAMLTTVRAGVTGAWYTGAVECGIQPGEMTAEEKLALENAIAYENQWIAGFANAIEQGNQANGGKLESLWPRSEIWIGRWEGVRDKAKVMACGDKKLEWVQGPTSDKCSSCTRLNGKVKRASYWRDKGILPRTHGAEYLECRGFRCLCELVETDKPLSRGPLPKLP